MPHCLIQFSNLIPFGRNDAVAQLFLNPISSISALLPNFLSHCGMLQLTVLLGEKHKSEFYIYRCPTLKASESD